MSRLLLFLSLIGAAIYSLLIYTHHVLTDDKAEKTYAEQTQANHPGPHLSSWDTYLPDRKVSKDSKLATSQLSTSLPLLESDEPRQNSERGAEQPATSSVKVSSSGSDGAEPEPELVKVVLAAQTHSQASVSSPTVRFYRPGTKLQVVRREGIWFEVSDPVTQERGWVLAQYLASIDGPTPTQVATESTAEPLTVKPASPKSNKRHRSAKPVIRAPNHVATADPWNPRSARRADRRRGVGLYMFAPRRLKPNAGYRRCAAWSEGFCVQNY
jgi:hypothetical protein